MIYVTDISGYDRSMFEDDERNVLKESMELFHEVCNCRWLQRTRMVLCLNKSDLFRHKICTQGKSLKLCFPDYDGRDGDYDHALEFVRQQFLSGVREKKRGRSNNYHICTPVTCMIDRENVKKVWNDLQHVIVFSALSRQWSFDF